MFENPAFWSAIAAFASAFFAGLTFCFTRRLSTREKLEIVKVDILVFTAGAERRSVWVKTSQVSQEFEGGGIGPKVERLADLLVLQHKRYKKEKWMYLIPAAIEELRKQGYEWL